MTRETMKARRVPARSGGPTGDGPTWRHAQTDRDAPADRCAGGGERRAPRPPAPGRRPAGPRVGRGVGEPGWRMSAAGSGPARGMGAAVAGLLPLGPRGKATIAVRLVG